MANWTTGTRVGWIEFLLFVNLLLLLAGKTETSSIVLIIGTHLIPFSGSPRH
jgi:hypothetical protein